MKGNKIEEEIKNIVFTDEFETFPLQEQTWGQIALAMQQRKQRLIPANWYQMLAAACILLGAVLLVSVKTTITSDGEPQQFQLPDGSLVELAIRSQVSYNRCLWLVARNVRLKGDATFEVTKGRQFRVRADKGTITVLGTKFFVGQQQGQILHVACFEGSVRVATEVGREVLHPGEQIDFVDGKMRLSEITPPLPEYLDYTNASLTTVVEALEDIFGLEITGMELCEGIIYSGVMSTRNEMEALEVVLSSCGLKYSLDGNHLTITR